MVLLMRLLNFYYHLIDFPLRVKFVLLRKLGKFSAFSSTERSDSDSTPYSNYVKSVLSNDSKYGNFRRNYSYRLILEHVDFKLGLEYLNLLTESTVTNYLNNPSLLNLSILGSPRKFYYSRLGWISPTIIRYLFVHQHISEIFNKIDFENVGEIGVGFGGQCAVTTTLGSIENYSAYDLPEVLSLTQKTLINSGSKANILKKMHIQNVAPTSFDLVISNYAFSELPANVQLDYIRKVLCRSQRGYLTMNSGRSDHTGRSQGKLSLTEILALIPGSSTIEEVPLTGPDNYILVWGK